MDFEGDTYAFNPKPTITQGDGAIVPGDGYQTWFQRNKVGPNNLKEGKFNQKMVFIMQHYEGPNSNYSHMSCNEAMKKLHFYYNPPVPGPNVTNVSIINETNHTNGTVTVTLSSATVSSGSEPIGVATTAASKGSLNCSKASSWPAGISSSASRVRKLRFR